MLIDLLKEFILELMRVLFLEALCRRVKNHLETRAHKRGVRRHQALLRWLQVRHREQLLHKLTTGAEEKL